MTQVGNRRLLRIAVISGTLGVAVALLIMGLWISVSWWAEPAWRSRSWQLLDFLTPLFWPVARLLPPVYGAELTKRSLLAGLTRLALLNFIPWAFFGVCFYCAGLWLGWLRSGRTGTSVKGDARQRELH